jgi:transposase
MEQILEPIPEKRISYKKGKNGTVYVYYIIRAYRNQYGHPTGDEALIGKKAEVPGMFIPNKRYYTIFPDRKPAEQIATAFETPQPITPYKIKCCGEPIVMLDVAKQMGLLDVLQECFPTKWKDLLVVAFYMVSQSKAMSYIEDWFDEISIDLVKSMNDVKCSRLFESISYEERQVFFKAWAKYRSEREYIFVDVTSISTSCKANDLAEMGYNRDHDKLPQVNCGMFVGEKSSLPIYYDMYSGSIPDKTNFEYMMKKAKDLGLEQVTFVLDRGFETKENFVCMLSGGYSFITAMSDHRIKAKELINQVQGKIENMENWIKEYNVFGMSQSFLFEGHNLQAHIYFSNAKKDNETIDYNSYIEKLRQELEQLNHSDRIPKRYNDHFVIKVQSKKKFTFELDLTKVNQELKQMGYFVLLTNNSELASSEVLKIYRSRDVIEKHFDQLKNDMDFKRLRTHKQKTAEGKFFVGFIALNLHSYMLNVIKNNPKTEKLSFEKVLIELKKIRTVVMSDMKETLITLNNLQKTILNAFQIKNDLLLC